MREFIVSAPDCNLYRHNEQLIKIKIFKTINFDLLLCVLHLATL